VFDDPLFIEASHGLSLRLRTQNLAPLLADTLKGLEKPDSTQVKFTPTNQLSVVFILSTTDFGTLTVLPKILDQFRQERQALFRTLNPWNE